MEQMPVVMPKTIRAIHQLLRSGRPPDTRHRTLDLLLAVAALERHIGAGRPALMVPALLRDLVIITNRLAGRTWLEANADAAAAFLELQATVQPPPLPELDHILAQVLTDRFGLAVPWQLSALGEISSRRRQGSASDTAASVLLSS